MKKTPAARSVLSNPESWGEAYADALYAFAFYRIPDKSVAEELVQETFLSALSARKNYKGQSIEKTWFTGILNIKSPTT